MDKITADHIDQEIETWFGAHFHNNALSRDGKVYNIAYEAKADLKARLRSLIEPEPVKQPENGEDHDSGS